MDLFYKTFFFINFDNEDETNDFTFYLNYSDKLFHSKTIETYLLNIGVIILTEENESKLFEALFSKEIPEFLINII